jgi:hypothetical protein
VNVLVCLTRKAKVVWLCADHFSQIISLLNTEQNHYDPTTTLSATDM